MKAVQIIGSRNPHGQTARAVAAFADGMTSRGVEVASHLLPTMEIERCRQCDDDGWGICRTEGRCTIDDDFASLVDQIKGADVVAFATPVYYSDLSESMRAFLDRLRRTCTHEAGRSSIQGKRAVGICVAGGGGGGGPACAVQLEKVLATCGFDLVDVIPVRRQNLDTKLGVLRATGEWLAHSIE